MKTIFELFKEDDVDESLEVHDSLNPKIWNNNKLEKTIRDKILLIVSTFKDILKENDIDINIKDILITGSNANYNYTDKSDIDVHIIADLKNNDYLGKIYDCYKTLFNNRYSITLKGIPVELYIEDAKNVGEKSHGVYSVIKDKWLQDPQIEEISEIDEDELNKRFDYWLNRYNKLLSEIDSGKKSEEDYIKDIEAYIDEIYQIRQEGLLDSGEYSLKNQLFKEVRNADIIDDLRSKKIELVNSLLSLK